MPNSVFAGGPRYVAGVSYFNPAVLGQPVVWARGLASYSVDQGPLNATVSNAQATAMVDAAAAIWNTVPTAAVTLTDVGNLAEDVDSSNVIAAKGAFLSPADITPGAIATPVAVIFDADGSVIDALYGSGASQPDNCTLNSVFVWIDNMTPNANIAHGVIVLNGRCATTPAMLSMMSFQLERAFGRILGLDFSQVNDYAQANIFSEPNGVLGQPIMQPLNGDCGASGGTCIPNPGILRYDDIAALNRLYPVTAANQASFPGKLLTAANTVSIQGTVSFKNGVGMQGVNVVARPLDQNGNPLYQYTVTFVSGAYFAGNRGNAITGFEDQYGNRLDRFGSNQPALQGFFDLSGIPLPPGISLASYQVSFEPINPLYIDSISVGPYILGSPIPSGKLTAKILSNLAAGSTQHVDLISSFNLPAPSPRQSTASQPIPLPSSGMWTSRLNTVGASDWLILPIRGNRLFTVVAQALDETGIPTASKAMPALGVWDGFDPVGVAAPGSTTAQNGIAPGETWLQVATSGQEIVRLGVEDQRGDGRPDFLYRGWVLYVDSVSPSRLPASGSQIVIRGTGFRSGDTVSIGGVAASVISILPTQITAMAQAGTASGSLDLQVSDLASFNAIAVIPGGISYDSAIGDGLHLVTAPSNQVPMNVPKPFTVLAEGADGNPAGGVTVTYSVTTGSVGLGCGHSSCSIIASGDGRATMPVTATSTALAIVTASLTNGASIQTQFYGATPASLTTLTPTLYLAASSTVSWPVQALAQSAGLPLAAQQISWQTVPGITAPAVPSTCNAAGIATATLTVSNLAAGQTAVSNACSTGTATCAAFTAFGARPEFATLSAVSGVAQSMQVGNTAAPVAMRVLDMNGNELAGATVTVKQVLYAWAPPCPRHGRCASSPLLASTSVTLTSGLDGSIVITPLSLPGIATTLKGISTTGNSGNLAFSIEEHP